MLLQTKPVTKSKINLVGILLFLAGLASLADTLPEEYRGIIMAVSGIAIIVLRTFYTNIPIAFPGRNE